MSVLRGDCVSVMAGMEPGSVDAIVTDPPYLIGFMGKAWDGQSRSFLERRSVSASGGFDARAGNHHPTSQADVWRTAVAQGRRMYEFHHEWAAAALRVAAPGAWLLAFGGTRTVHRMACAVEDAGWIIRDMIIWGHAQGFPKSRSCLKPAFEPIILARKPGPLRALDIDGCRIGTGEGGDREGEPTARTRYGDRGIGFQPTPGPRGGAASGRWPANLVLTDPVLDGGWEGVVGGGEQSGGGNPRWRSDEALAKSYQGRWRGGTTGLEATDTAGTYSRFFMVPKAPTSERTVNGRRSPHPTQKPEALIRHLVRLVTPPGGLVLDPFLGSGTLGVVCEGLGVRWLGIEREAEYADWAEARIAANRPQWQEATG